MSARDTLLDLFLHGGLGSQPEFEQALDAYAHELAEKIREDSWRRRDRWGRYENETRERGMEDAAALIDPEASHDGG